VEAGRSLLHCQTGSQRLQRNSDFEDLGQLGERGAKDRGAAELIACHEAFGLEPRDCISNRRAADGKALGEVDFPEAGTARKASVDDARSERVKNLGCRVAAWRG
jgi:hypothetical protein